MANLKPNMEDPSCPNSITCFNNGVSFIEIPISMKRENKNEENISTEECIVGPLPSSVILGTVSLVAEDPGALKILSLRQTTKSKEKLNIPSGPDFSFQEFLRSNMDTTVTLSLSMNENGDVEDVVGVVKWVQEEKDDVAKAIIELEDGNDVLISCLNIKEIRRSKKKKLVDIY